MRFVIIRHKEMEEEWKIPILNQEAYFPIYTEDYGLVLVIALNIPLIILNYNFPNNILLTVVIVDFDKLALSLFCKSDFDVFCF